MPTTRKEPLCALVRNQITGDNEIVAAGGVNTGEHIRTVEIFNMKTKLWRTAGATFAI
jgi:hypothetical protein